MQFSPDGLVAEVLSELRAAFVDAVPKLITALVFLAVAYVAIKLALTAIRSALGRIYAGNDLVADLFGTIAAVFLWFGAALTLLKILGMGDIAASLGTATGFVALGVSYALSEMIADTVSGVYLLRDPDFDPGDRVETADVSGVVREIGLRKTRLEVESGDTVVLGNSSVEEKWTKKSGSVSSASGLDAESDSTMTGLSDEPKGADDTPE
jgi:small-conductance mechanosensitive channel